MRQLNRRIGLVTPEIQARIQTLSIAQLEELGEALLDFSQPTNNPYFWIVHKFLPSPLATHIGWL